MVVTCSYPFKKYFKWWCFIDFPVRYVSLPEGSYTLGSCEAPSDKYAVQNAGDQFTNGAPLGCQQSSMTLLQGKIYEKTIEDHRKSRENLWENHVFFNHMFFLLTCWLVVLTYESQWDYPIYEMDWNEHYVFPHLPGEGC